MSVAYLNFRYMINSRKYFYAHIRAISNKMRLIFTTFELMLKFGKGKYLNAIISVKINLGHIVRETVAASQLAGLSCTNNAKWHLHKANFLLVLSTCSSSIRIFYNTQYSIKFHNTLFFFVKVFTIITFLLAHFDYY